MKKYIYFIFLLILLSGCKAKKTINDIILNTDYLNNHFKFTISIYYNKTGAFIDLPLEMGEIKNDYHEIKKEVVYYERSFKLFLDTYFPPELEVCYNKDEYNSFMAVKNSFCEIRNEDGELLYWFALYLNEVTNELVINNYLIKNGKPIIDYFLCEIFEENEEIVNFN